MPARTYAQHVSKRGPTKQTQPIPGREAEMSKNHAGGVVFTLDDWSRLDRFLILGAEGNTYYASERDMVIGNAQAAVRCIKEDGERVVTRIVEISDAGRAPKNDPALFVLALCASADDVKTRQAAFAALPKVARIGTHLFHFAEYVKSQRGWGRALRRAVGNWYEAQPIERLVSQVTKYQSRDGWSNRDLLRLSHPKTDNKVRAAVYDWACGRTPELEHPLLAAIDALKAKPDAETAVEAILTHELPRECIPTELLNDPDVWAALLKEMPLQAMVRNLGKMSAVGLLKPLSREIGTVIDALGNEEAIRKSRLHPMSVLLALKIYAQGKGDKGKLTWTPVPQIVDALDGAFYAAFKNVEPTGKRILIGVDVSGSMSTSMASSALSAAEGAAALAMTVARTEKNYHIFGFADSFRELNITAKTSMKDALRTTRDKNFGNTDCALPMIEAQKRGWDVDAFMVITDNETWYGDIHPSQALAQYRKARGIDAKLIVVGMTATQFTIADPKDNGMLDCVGFDANMPAIISDFIRG